MAMQRFYFHIRNGVDARDEEGKELRDLEAAREHARQCAIFSAAEAVRIEGTLFAAIASKLQT